MAKPDPALLDPSRYPFRCNIVTRYRDLDSNLHLNNGVMACLLEEGRVHFHREAEFGNRSFDGENSAMVASLAIEFIGESHFPEPLEIHIGIAHLGNTSYELAQLVMQGDQVVVFARVTLVATRQGKPSPLSDERRAIARQWMLNS